VIGVVLAPGRGSKRAGGDSIQPAPAAH
jgi:hypothetical protein